jgi:hypothetical protein
LSEAFSLDLAGLLLWNWIATFANLRFFGAHALKMEVIFDGFAAVPRRAGDLSIAGHGSVVTPVRLLVAA